MSIARRVQLTGRSTYIISIPKEWARSLGITRGSKVFVDLLPDNSLRIRAEPKLADIKLIKIIDLRRDQSIATAIREFIAAYIAGYDTFKIYYDESSIGALRDFRKFIESRVANIIVSEEASSSLTYKIVGAPRPMSVVDALSWLYRLVNMMFAEVIKGIRSRNLEVLSSVIERDNVVDKAFLVVVRNLSSTMVGAGTIDSLGLKSQAEALHYYRAFKTIERIGDHIALIASRVSKLLESNTIIRDDLVEVLEESMNYFSDIAKSLIKIDIDTSRRVALDIEQFRLKIRELGRIYTDIEYHDIIMSLIRILDYTIDLAETTFDIVSIRGVSETIYSAY